ncbi:LOW QUALITY PROTEIN: mitochondrial import inner membrane translocase subunit Tim10 B [Eudromia elegans]
MTPCRKLRGKATGSSVTGAGGSHCSGMEHHGEQPEQQQLRSLRDFLLLYNRMTELCFRHCVPDLNHRLLSGREEQCLDGCAGKLLHANHRLLRAYVALLPALAQRRAAAAAAPQAAPRAARHVAAPA